VAGFISEWWPASFRYRGRHQIGIGGRIASEFAREFEGFWLATVKRIDKGEFTLEWFDAPEYPPFKSPLRNIAVPHPEFRVSGK